MFSYFFLWWKHSLLKGAWLNPSKYVTDQINLDTTIGARGPKKNSVAWASWSCAKLVTYITLHYITLHYITLHYITLHYITLHYITLHYITLHYITAHYITSHHITSHHITSHYITLHHITSHYITLHHITSHHITSHRITSHHIASHRITSHRITSHHITLHYINVISNAIYTAVTSCGASTNTRNTANRPSTQDSYKEGRVRDQQRKSTAAAQIAATLGMISQMAPREFKQYILRTTTDEFNVLPRTYYHGRETEVLPL